MRVQIIVFDSY